MRTYNQFKFNFGIEPYLLNIENIKYRHAIARLRTSSHPLAIEKGRHGKGNCPITERICKLCNVIEDEQHFLIVCHMYSKEQEQLFLSTSLDYENFFQLDSNGKFIFLMSITDDYHLTKLAKFIASCFKIHQVYNNCMWFYCLWTLFYLCTTFYLCIYLVPFYCTVLLLYTLYTRNNKLLE